MLMLCAFPVHRVDPQNFIMYMHVMNIVRAVQDKKQVQVAWEEAYNARRHRQGLCTTYLHYMRALQLEVEGEPFAWRVGEENMDIRYTARHKLGHALRERMRQQALQEAARRRTHLAGAEGACCDTLKKCVGKHEGVLRSEILMVLCDGIWTQSKKYKAGLIPTPKCVWCGEYEDIEHIVYRCTRWRAQRDMFRDDIPMLLDGPPCRRLCLIPDVDVPPHRKKQWPKVVERVAALLRCRLQELPRPRERMSQVQDHSESDYPKLPRRGTQFQEHGKAATFLVATNSLGNMAQKSNRNWKPKP